MKKFTILAVNFKTNKAVVIAKIEAKTVKAARIQATAKYFKYLEVNEQLVVANDEQYEKYWRAVVERTDALASN